MDYQVKNFTTLEHLVKLLHDGKNMSECDIEKQVLDNIQNMIQKMILDDFEEDIMISFYMMTRRHVNENMTPEESLDEMHFAKASFSHNFNAKHEFKKHMNHLTKNN